MNARRKPANNILLTFVKILIFVFALYLAYIVLRPLLSILLGIGFWFIKVIVFLAVAILIIHLFLKIIFGINLFSVFAGRTGRR